MYASMKRKPKAKPKVVVHATIEPPRSTAVAASDVPNPEAFLEEAKSEPKRKLILDHLKTIGVLRNDKNFTFTAIAEWFSKRGFETDRSAVYRAYLLSIKPSEVHPDDEEFAEELRQMEPD